MNQLKNTLTLILLIAFANFGRSQSCYQVIADMSGFDISPYQTELESAACELKNAFPTEFQDQFKVYDFGFYSQNEFMQGGFQAVWDKVVSEIPTQYYLVFGKQTDGTGIYTKFWIDLKLPTTGNFECFNQTQYNLLELSILEKVNNTYSESGNSPSYYSNSQKEGILYLMERILDMIECCQPNLRNPQSSCSGCPNELDIATYFQSKDFDEYNITIQVDNFGNPIELEPVSNDYIQDFALNVYEHDGLVIDPYSEIEAELNNLGLNELAVGVITNNYSLCVDPVTTALRSSSNPQALELFNNNYTVDGKIQIIVYHIWLNPDGSGQDKLFKKFLYANEGSLEEVAQALDPSNIGVQSPTEYDYPLTELDDCDNETVLYEIVKDSDGKYYGYELSGCEWQKKDIVEFIHPSPYPNNPSDEEYLIGSQITPTVSYSTGYRPNKLGNLVEVQIPTYTPCELCYKYTIGNKKNISTNDLMKGFYGWFEVGWTHQIEKDILFNSFVYGKGQPVVWNTESSISTDLVVNERVQTNLTNIETEIGDWLSQNGNLDGLINSNILRDIATNINPNFTKWDLPSLWPTEMFGGIQGRSVRIVKLKEINSSNCPSNTLYQCEFVYTLYDNFGLDSDENTWYPGMPQQWVLQHYRNGYTSDYKAFSPVTKHQVEFHHSFEICKQ